VAAALLAILFGAAFTLLVAYALGVLLLCQLAVPPEIALGVGAISESLLVLVLLFSNAGHWAVFLCVGAAALAALRWFRRAPLEEAVKRPLGKARIAAAVILGAYGVWYFINALAPETVADGVTYHLGLPYEYVRLGGFPQRMAFYDMVPQGMEMLYTVAFALGRHSAAKLVEFAFFLATVPLIFRIGRRLHMGDRASLVAVALYFCAPVAGITGSCSYTDGALVFFTLAAFYLLLVWRDTRDDRYLLPAGALAGFCYAIKMPGIMVAAGVLLFALAARRPRAAALVAVGAAIAIAPWMARAFALTGNPVAPLMNVVFPNPYFHVADERELAATLRSLGPVRRAGVPWELAFGDRLTGTFGPLLLALPAGLPALRRREGRMLWAAAALLALPWFSNTGARFLMPSVAFAALALGMVLPRPAAWAALVIQAVLCWPQAIDAWETRYAFRLHEFPWRAALRLEPEGHYLERRVDDYAVAKLLEKVTARDARVLALLTVANAYLSRDVTVTWQSAEGNRLLDSLRLASIYSGDPLYAWTASWLPGDSLRGLRFRLPAAIDGELDASEVELYAGRDQVHNSPQWTLRGWSNPWEAPLAFDHNLATRWRTWERARAGTFLEIDFDHPQRLTAATVLSHVSARSATLEFDGQALDGQWHLLSRVSTAQMRAREDLRHEAMRTVRHAGFRYILAPTRSGGNAPLGQILATQEAEWGLQRAGEAGQFVLWRVK